LGLEVLFEVLLGTALRALRLQMEGGQGQATAMPRVGWTV
jgi:hypothetical protein